MVNRAVILKFVDFINLQYAYFIFNNCNTTLIYHRATIFCLNL